MKPKRSDKGEGIHDGIIWLTSSLWRSGLHVFVSRVPHLYLHTPITDQTDARCMRHTGEFWGPEKWQALLVTPVTSHTGNTLDQWMGWTGKVKLNQEVKPCLTVVQRYVRLTPLNTTTDEMGSNLYGYIFNISLPLQKNMNVLWVPTRVKTEYTDRRPETKSLDFIK